MEHEIRGMPRAGEIFDDVVRRPEDVAPVVKHSMRENDEAQWPGGFTAGCGALRSRTRGHGTEGALLDGRSGAAGRSTPVMMAIASAVTRAQPTQIDAVTSSRGVEWKNAYTTP